MYSKCGRSRDARNMFELMDKSDTVTWNAMTLGFVDMQLGHMAVECFSELQRMGIKNDQTTLCTVLPMCDLRCGKQVHAYIRIRYSDPIVPVWNALVHMYSKYAISFIEKTPLKPDKSIWEALFSACRVYQNVDVGTIAAEYLICLESE
ncbi:hypothetical protein DITRI_Ditri18aG0092900 [Diplodiscus trichospermus]